MNLRHILILSALLLISACSTGVQNTTEDSAISSSGLEQKNSSTSNLAMQQAAINVRDQMADWLQLDRNEVQITSVEKHEFSDSCLGMPLSDEPCKNEITPGYVIHLMIEGKDREIRTDLNVTLIRN